jgi:hypothetical protein
MDILKQWIGKECPPQKNDCQNGRNKKRGRPQEKWTDEVQEDLKIMGIRNLHTVARDEKE